MVDSKLSVSVKGVVLRNTNADAEVLLLRNDREEWQLPGGRIEGGETPEQCLAREFKEETGLLVSVGSCVDNGLLTVVADVALTTGGRLKSHSRVRLGALEICLYRFLCSSFSFNLAAV
jgi:8-oxo-dGTP pyrophosphatase MutT (NUDIX family)